jgi:hypothetical protein
LRQKRERKVSKRSYSKLPRSQLSETFKNIFGRDAPDIRLIQKPDTGYPAGYPVRAGYRISGRILDFKTIFLVKYQVPGKFFKSTGSFNNYRLLQISNKA